MKVLHAIFTFLILALIISMLWVYWFVGFSDVSLSPGPQNSNFSAEAYTNENIQFYENMRYPSKRISYRISDICTLQKKYDAEMAFEILENQTILDFYASPRDEDILIGCEERQIIKEDFFVAGEGGPVNITRAGDFNIIYYGEIMLIRDSECPNPNIALHEILHALGFDHSGNPNNIMYNISKCSQTFGEDIPLLINNLYSIPELPDLILEDAFPLVHGKYLDLEINAKNNGIGTSGGSVLNIYLDDEITQSIDVPSLDAGFGIKFTLKNIKLKKINFDKIRFVVEGDFEEFDKANNEISFVPE